MILVSEVEYNRAIKTLDYTLKTTTTQEMKASKTTLTELNHFCVGGNRTFKAATKVVIKDEKNTFNLHYLTA